MVKVHVDLYCCHCATPTNFIPHTAITNLWETQKLALYNAHTAFLNEVIPVPNHKSFEVDLVCGGLRVHDTDGVHKGRDVDTRIGLTTVGQRCGINYNFKGGWMLTFSVREQKINPGIF